MAGFVSDFRERSSRVRQSRYMIEAQNLRVRSGRRLGFRDRF
ncbi:hypothetical protein B4100_2833 [Heyndrickxia coagulans]|nr:hypothetical protein B4100_2833 [Heyndrickxia coagulans]